MCGHSEHMCLQTMLLFHTVYLGLMPWVLQANSFITSVIPQTGLRSNSQSLKFLAVNQDHSCSC